MSDDDGSAQTEDERVAELCDYIQRGFEVFFVTYADGTGAQIIRHPDSPDPLVLPLGAKVNSRLCPPGTTNTNAPWPVLRQEQLS